MKVISVLPDDDPFPFDEDVQELVPGFGRQLQSVADLDRRDRSGIAGETFLFDPPEDEFLALGKFPDEIRKRVKTLILPEFSLVHEGFEAQKKDLTGDLEPFLDFGKGDAAFLDVRGMKFRKIGDEFPLEIIDRLPGDEMERSEGEDADPAGRFQGPGQVG